MKRVKLILLLIVAICLGFSANTMAAPASAAESDTVSFAMHIDTTAARAVFASFLSVIPNVDDPDQSVDSAISVSNVCAAPAEVVDTGLLGDGASAPGNGNGAVSEAVGSDFGTITVYLWDRDGTLITHTTGAGSPGAGLDADGQLQAGQTWTVRLAEVLSAELGISEEDIEFNGYAWVTSGFDCLAGTYNVTIFGVGFTQNFEFLPGMGQGQIFGGIPVNR